MHREIPRVHIFKIQASRFLERIVLLVNVGVFVEHVYKLFFSSTVLGEMASKVGQPRGAGSNLHGCHPPHWTTAAQEEDYNLNYESCFVSFGFCS